MHGTHVIVPLRWAGAVAPASMASMHGLALGLLLLARPPCVVPVCAPMLLRVPRSPPIDETSLTGVPAVACDGREVSGRRTTGSLPLCLCR